MGQELTIEEESKLMQRWIQAPHRMFVADTNGNTTSFKMGEIKLLVGSLVLPAMQAGGLVVQGPDGAVVDTADLDAPDPKVLEASVRNACHEIRAKGDPTEFTTSGRPRVPDVEKICAKEDGIDKEYIDAKLVNNIWADIIEGR